jgi:hypothetical protein
VVYRGPALGRPHGTTDAPGAPGAGNREGEVVGEAAAPAARRALTVQLPRPLAAGDAQQLKVTLSLPLGTADAAMAGESAVLEVRWRAEAAR